MFKIDSEMTCSGTRCPEPSAEFDFCFLFGLCTWGSSQELIIYEALLAEFEPIGAKSSEVRFRAGILILLGVFLLESRLGKGGK